MKLKGFGSHKFVYRRHSRLKSESIKTYINFHSFPFQSQQTNSPKAHQLGKTQRIQNAATIMPTSIASLKEKKNNKTKKKCTYSE